MKRLVIFDCDGVLVDSERISHTVLQQMLAEQGVVLSFEATVQRFIGTSIPVCQARIAELVPALPADFYTTLEKRTREAFQAGLPQCPVCGTCCPAWAMPAVSRPMATMPR